MAPGTLIRLASIVTAARRSSLEAPSSRLEASEEGRRGGGGEGRGGGGDGIGACEAVWFHVLRDEEWSCMVLRREGARREGCCRDDSARGRKKREKEKEDAGMREEDAVGRKDRWNKPKKKKDAGKSREDTVCEEKEMRNMHRRMLA